MKNKRRIGKIILFTRGLLLALFVVFLLLSAATADYESLKPMIVCFVASFICFCAAVFCDYLLGSQKSPFYY